jgi:DNA-binding GntR family transcriptional regulator
MDSMDTTLTFPLRKTVQHRTIAAAVAAELRRRILDGEIPAGSQLRQDALAAEFAVSRIPVRLRPRGW